MYAVLREKEREREREKEGERSSGERCASVGATMQDNAYH